MTNGAGAAGRSARRWALRLGGDAASAARARSAVRAWLGGGDRALEIDAVLVVSELVTNAVRHGRPPIVLSAEFDGERLRLEVRDAGDGRPRTRRPGPAGGWGLIIVDRIAQRWGAAARPARVWCELPARERPTTSAPA